MNRCLLAVLWSAILLLALPNCYRMRSSKGGGQTGSTTAREINTADVAVPQGYKVDVVTTGLTFPTGVALDDSNHLYVIEAGYSYGEVWGEPRLLRIGPGGTPTIVVRGTKNGPWTGITWHNGAFYVAEGGEMEGGRILRITKDGSIQPLIANLPSVGDHHTNGPAIRNGYIYFGQGTATNSGVVGEDNWEFGWLKRKRDFHDIPCQDIVLAGQNYGSGNPLTDDPADTATTGAYVPFGTPTRSGQVIRGAVPCTGSILRLPLEGGKPEVVAWGLRNPFGLSFAPDGRLFVTENGFDERGSRRVWGAGDVLWEIKQGTWYGWPDFSAGKPIRDDEEFKPPTSRNYVKPVLQSYPNTPPQPTAIFGVHSSSNGIDFSRSEAFGFKVEAFVAQLGDMAPKVGKVVSPVGFKVVRVNVANGVIRDFATNKGKRNGPATWLKKGGLERPVSVRFSPDGNGLYIVDFGIMTMTDQGPQPQMNTGVVWRVTRQ